MREGETDALVRTTPSAREDRLQHGLAGMELWLSEQSHDPPQANPLSGSEPDRPPPQVPRLARRTGTEESIWVNGFHASVFIAPQLLGRVGLSVASRRRRAR